MTSNLSQKSRSKWNFAYLCFIIALFLSLNAGAQNDAKKVSGVVLGVDNKPLAGAAVKVSETGLGVTTKEDGKFTISVKNKETILVSFVGYLSKSIRYSGQNSLEVSLIPSAENQLSDVVVTGFQKISKTKFGGAAVTLKADAIKTEGITDVSRMLEGKVAGVVIQNPSGTFGAAPKVRIRGATSLNGANKPLWVIDGVALEDIVSINNDQLTSGDPTTLLGSPVAGLNPGDIESMDILKDASAAALYGARAMNGVIVITTKRGKTGKVSINYSANFSSQLKPSYNQFNTMNSAEQMSVLANLDRGGFFTSNIASNANYAMYGKMYNLLAGTNNGTFPLQNTPEAKERFLLRYANANTDWLDLLFKNSFLQEHSLSLNFGSDKAQSYFSVSYLDDMGWTVADKVKRYTLNFNNNYILSDKLSFGFSTLASFRQQKAPGAVNREGNPVDGTYNRDFDINPFNYALNVSRAVTAYDENGNPEFLRAIMLLLIFSPRLIIIA